VARRPDGEVARSEVLRLRLTRDELAAIDTARGEVPRSEFVRAAVVAAMSVPADRPEHAAAAGHVPAAEPAAVSVPVSRSPELARGRGRRLGHPFAPNEPGGLPPAPGLEELAERCNDFVLDVSGDLA
jgi:hypothetical protein